MAIEHHRRGIRILQCERDLSSTALDCTSLLREVDQHPAHRPRGHREQVLPIPPLDVLEACEAEVRFVDETVRLQRVSCRLTGELMACDPAQSLMQQPNDLPQRGRVAATGAVQQAGDLALLVHAASDREPTGPIM